MENACPFIESLVENNYDESGQVILSNEFNFSNWKSKQEYVNVVRTATKGQKISAVVSFTIAAILFGYAMYLHRKLVFRKPWKPPRHANDPISDYYRSAFDSRAEAGRISRSNSGIMQNRSFSTMEGQSINDSTVTGNSSRIISGRSVVAHGDLSYKPGSTAKLEPSAGTFA